MWTCRGDHGDLMFFVKDSTRNDFDGNHQAPLFQKISKHKLALYF